ncbi:MAG: alpha-ketoglutarate-dependent dioxygenase AlkB [Roseobacter sp.]
MTHLRVLGFEIHKNFLNAQQQYAILNSIRDVVKTAPLFAPVTPRGQPMSVRMTAAGKYGWITDRRGYRYEPLHPHGTAWPPIPEPILQIWRSLADTDVLPECCLINFYGEGARMGMHQDKDEARFDCPVVSVSLGDDGLFRMGGTARGGKTQSVWLQSGDVVVMGGDARLSHHGVDRIRFGSSSLLEKGGRLNLTLRVVSPPPSNKEVSGARSN